MIIPTAEELSQHACLDRMVLILMHEVQHDPKFPELKHILEYFRREYKGDTMLFLGPTSSVVQVPDWRRAHQAFLEYVRANHSGLLLLTNDIQHSNN